MHNEQSDECVVGVVGHPGDTAHPFRPSRATQMPWLSVGVDLDVANAWCELFVTSQARDEVGIRRCKCFDFRVSSLLLAFRELPIRIPALNAGLQADMSSCQRLWELFARCSTCV